MFFQTKTDCNAHSYPCLYISSPVVRLCLSYLLPHTVCGLWGFPHKEGPEFRYLPWFFLNTVCMFSPYSRGYPLTVHSIIRFTGDYNTSFTLSHFMHLGKESNLRLLHLRKEYVTHTNQMLTWYNRNFQMQLAWMDSILISRRVLLGV